MVDLKDIKNRKCVNEVHSMFAEQILSKILANVIKEAKKHTYNNQINKSTNKIKTTWNIIKKETNRHKRLNYVTNYENHLRTLTTIL
jgi:hypothetical protein